jgi:hypothetical protein
LQLNNGATSILGLDPGGTTGYALYQAQTVTNPEGGVEWFDERWTHGELGPLPHHDMLYDMLGQFQTTNYIIVCESFEYRRNPRDSQRDNIVLDSKEYIGIVKLFQMQRMLPIDFHGHGAQRVVFQTAAEGKAFWFPQKDPAKLKKIGLYQRGSMHMNDATAHLLHYLTFKLNRNDLLEKLK